MLAAAPMIGLLVALCLVPGAAPRVVGTARAAAPPPAAHPPTRDYDLDLPPLLPAVPDTGPTTAAGTPTPPVPDGQPPASATASPPPAAKPPPATRTRAPTLTLTAADRRIPARMLTAYRKAADRTAVEQPGCHLRWQLLAGIGRIESGHGIGRTITAEGTIISRILGPALDGHDGRALVRDTDAGRLDGDRRYDRAVGPMQFIPTTWAWAGRDGSGDGRADPNNVDDATLSAAGYLCRHDRDLADPAALRAAIYSYNPSASYLRAVLAWTAGYTTTPVLPSPRRGLRPEDEPLGPAHRHAQRHPRPGRPQRHRPPPRRRPLRRGRPRPMPRPSHRTVPCSSSPSPPWAAPDHPARRPPPPDAETTPPPRGSGPKRDAMPRPTHYPPAFRTQAVAQVIRARSGYASEWAAIQAVATTLAISAETLRT